MGSLELRLVGGEERSQVEVYGRDGREVSQKSCCELCWCLDGAVVGYYSYLVRGMYALTGGQGGSDLRWVALIRPSEVSGVDRLDWL